MRSQVGYVSERDTWLPHMSGFDATRYVARLSGMNDAEARRRSHKALLRVGLGDVRYRDVAACSLGVRQRVKLAQAIVHSPRLLLLDEPTKGLDPIGRREILHLIRTQAEGDGVHVVLSSQIIREVETVCDEAIVLKDGRIVKREVLKDQAQPIGETYRVRISGDPAAFRRACESRGVSVLAEKDDEFCLGLTGDSATSTIFAASSESGNVVRFLKAFGESLDTKLYRLLDGGNNGRFSSRRV